jgi:tetratricopeptide (TPR) repeat protein
MKQLDTTALHEKLTLAMRKSDWASCETNIALLKQIDPTSRKTLLLELEYLISRDQILAAVSVFINLEALFADSARLHYLGGWLNYKQKNFKRALIYFEESNKLAPSEFTQQWCGRTLTRLQQYDEAMAIFQNLKEQKHILGELAWIYLQKANFEKAKDCYEEILRQDSQNEFAKKQLLQIKTKTLSGEALSEEVKNLEAIGETPPDPVKIAYLEKLLERGLLAEFREKLHTWHLLDSKFSYRKSLAWLSYHHKVYDCAFTLFFTELDQSLTNNKILNALDMAAKKCHRTKELEEFYESHLDRLPTLRGRIKKLRAKF